jgi:hypothetical protein
VDCSVNKGKQDRHVPWAAQERNIFSSAWQINDPFVTAVLARWSGVTSPSRWYQHKPDKTGSGTATLFGRRECRECIRNRISIRRRQKSRHRRFRFATPIIVLCDCRSQKFVALFRSVARNVSRFPSSSTARLHRLDSCGRERLGYVPNPATNQSFGRSGFASQNSRTTARDFRKEISSLKLKIVFV